MFGNFFKKSANSRENASLPDARLIVVTAHRATVSALNGLEQELGLRINPKVYRHVLYETTLFYLHYIDRIVFTRMSEEHRRQFMNRLARDTGDRLGEVVYATSGNRGYVPDGESKEELFRQGFLSQYNEQMAEYANYDDTTPRPGGGMGGTLFWEFGKRIARLVVRPKDVLVIGLLTNVLIPPIVAIAGRIPSNTD